MDNFEIGCVLMRFRFVSRGIAMTMMATMDGRGVDLRVCQIREDRNGLGSLSISNDLMGALASSMFSYSYTEWQCQSRP